MRRANSAAIGSSDIATLAIGVLSSNVSLAGRFLGRPRGEEAR